MNGKLRIKKLEEEIKLIRKESKSVGTMSEEQWCLNTGKSRASYFRVKASGETK